METRHRAKETIHYGASERVVFQSLSLLMLPLVVLMSKVIYTYNL